MRIYPNGQKEDGFGTGRYHLDNLVLSSPSLNSSAQSRQTQYSSFPKQALTLKNLPRVYNVGAEHLLVFTPQKVLFLSLHLPHLPHLPHTTKKTESALMFKNLLKKTEPVAEKALPVRCTIEILTDQRTGGSKNLPLLTGSPERPAKLRASITLEVDEDHNGNEVNIEFKALTTTVVSGNEQKQKCLG